MAEESLIEHCCPIRYNDIVGNLMELLDDIIKERNVHD